jgi:hypothetical protein
MTGGAFVGHHHAMRCLLVVMLVACTDPYGEYVTAVYQAGDGSLSVKLCDFKSNETANPEECHIEAVGPPPADDDAVTAPAVPGPLLRVGKLLQTRF